MCTVKRAKFFLTLLKNISRISLFILCFNYFCTVSFNLFLTRQKVLLPAQVLNMRKLMVALLLLSASTATLAQETTKSQKSPKNTSYNISRAGDHFMLQLSYDSWLGTPDSISSHIKGFQRGINVAVMLNKSFKSNPKFGIAGGLGVSSSNIYFKKMNVELGSGNKTLQFIPTDGTDNFKKYKLSTTYLEVPVEFRFSSNPSNPNKSVKAALGIKFGTIVNAHTKGKNLRDSSGVTTHNYIQKINTRGYFNSTRIAATARIGYGVFSIFGSYNLSSMFKTGVAADIRLLQIGLCISGL